MLSTDWGGARPEAGEAVGGYFNSAGKGEWRIRPGVGREEREKKFNLDNMFKVEPKEFPDG